MDRFDLEQSILNVWNVVDDMRLISEKECDDSHRRELINSLATIYDMKLQNLFDVYEYVVRNEWEKRMKDQYGTDQDHAPDEKDAKSSYGSRSSGTRSWTCD